LLFKPTPFKKTSLQLFQQGSASGNAVAPLPISKMKLEAETICIGLAA
jgi:hypothetical protein